MAKRGRAFQKEEAGCIKALGNKLLIHPASLGFPLIHLANHCCNIFQIAHCTALISLLIKKIRVHLNYSQTLGVVTCKGSLNIVLI